MHQAGIQHANDVNIPWTSLLAEAKVSTGSPWSNRITLVAKLKLGSRIQVACCKKHQYPEIHHFCAIKKLPHPLSLALINRKKIVITINNNNNSNNNNKNSNNNNNHS